MRQCRHNVVKWRMLQGRISSTLHSAEASYTYPCFVVDICTFLNEQLTNTCIAVMCCNVQWCKAALNKTYNKTMAINVQRLTLTLIKLTSLWTPGT